MKRLSEATTSDFADILKILQNLPEFATVEEAAQAFIDIIYNYFSSSLVLLRLFTSVRCGQLPLETRQFVDKRVRDTGTAHLVNDGTPILALLGTRGMQPDWNIRRKSQRFRCIPLASTAFVASLSMLSMQLKSMNFDLALIDTWDDKIAAKGCADAYSGMLYARNAATDKDDQGRMVVPMQDFVTEFHVMTSLGFGSGYKNHPTILTMFAFTNEIIDKKRVEPLLNLLEAFKSISESLIIKGHIFSTE